MGRKIRTGPFWAAAAVIVFLLCFLVNVGGAWQGDPASVNHFLATMFYIVFWGIFSVANRNAGTMFWVSFVMSWITFVSSVVCLMTTLFSGGELVVVLAVLLAAFSAVPMYGLRVFLDWTQLYSAAAVLSICWIIFTGTALRMGKRK